ncbi:Fatty acid metabolism regulator protein [Corynebacterium kalinowskii]|uniref:Fatty acid metabolism regulator protein n=1 Tax=Corynebacterium kalinowskii TaxID=2675216 RepID=A0A6B8W563_9CORY|nr:TetR/AcrR family transcriptional regulator [Corynebacterium kalinowskii]QGU02508.1 Fatty acid metabolism regulator protein [Corynebacterium kalinowskii]
MPKISGSSVAEHRAAQHKAVLAAGLRLIVEQGGQLPSISEVAREVGLARSSVYLYVSSGEDLLVQLLLAEIPAGLEKISAEIPDGATQSERIATYAGATFDLFVDGDHGPLTVAASQNSSAFADQRVQEAHAELVDARQRLLGVDELSCELIDAAIGKAANYCAQHPEQRDQIRAKLQRLSIAMAED